MEKIRGHISSFISHPLHTSFYIFVVAISVYLLTTPNYLYAVLPGICIFLLLALSRSHKIGYYIIFFLIPCDSFRELTESLGFLSVSKFLGLLLALIVVLDIFVHKHKLPSLKSNLWTWFLLFFIVNFISAMMSDYKSTSFDNVRQLLTVYIFVGLTIVLVSCKEFFKHLPIIIISSVSFVSFLSILGFIFNWEMFTMGIAGADPKRAIGASGDPNFFSAMIIFGMPFIYYYYISSRGFFIKTVSVLLFIVNVAAIVLTYSRGGSVVLALVLFLISLGYVRRFKPVHIGLAAGSFFVAIGIGITLIPDAYWERLKSISDLSDESLRARLSYLLIGLQIFIVNPIMGSGPGTFKEVYGGSIIARIFSYTGRSDVRYAHNSYLEIMSGIGIAGFIIFLVILWIALRDFYTARKNFRLSGNNDHVSLVSAYRLSFVSMLIYFFMLSAFYHKFFWASLAFSQIALKLSRETDSKKTR